MFTEKQLLTLPFRGTKLSSILALMLPLTDDPGITGTPATAGIAMNSPSPMMSLHLDWASFLSPSLFMSRAMDSMF